MPPKKKRGRKLAAAAGEAPVPVTGARGRKGKGKKKDVVGVDAPAASADVVTTTAQKRTRTARARGRGRPEAGCGDGPVVPAGPVKRGCRILFSGQFSGKGMSAEEWREWLAWMGDGQETVYHRYEAVGNPTEKGLDPTKERYVWEIETGEWVKKGAGRRAPVEEEEQVEDGEKSPVIGVGGRPQRVRRPPRWYGDY